MLRKKVGFQVALVMSALCAAQAEAENWPQWRGPAGNCVAKGEHYPTKWSDTENVAWKVALPGWGTSTPAVWEDRIFVTCQIEGKNALICLDRQGKQLWEVRLGDETTARNRKASGSNPSPTTDGEHVYIYYKSGDLACVDFDGQVVWQHNLQQRYGEDTLWWDLGTSPLLVDELLIVACIQTGPSYVVAFNKRTGEVVWKQDRVAEAPVESAQSYATPLLVSHAGQRQLVVLGADHVTAHDLASGEELWRLGGLNPEGNRNFRSIASPVATSDLLVVPYARGQTLTAIRLGGQGDVTASHVAWVNDEFSADVPTPTAFGGRIYVCGDRGNIACLDAATGKMIWSHQLPRNRYQYSSSPVVAAGRLYVTREDGVTFVLKLGDQFELLETNGIYEWTLATPVFTDGKILLRSAEHLYCVGDNR